MIKSLQIREINYRIVKMMKILEDLYYQIDRILMKFRNAILNLKIIKIGMTKVQKVNLQIFQNVQKCQNKLLKTDKNIKDNGLMK